ncbi:MAG: MlaD family protein [Ignavibacteriales bacterium]|nr:MAG: MCE family protein [Ignavibacteriaceae bacterium]MBW7872357.1 MCE family protein [Ignavibacteria bacterium]MCZ2142640.1 MlaD family protein [Ignavibacteriales bacterium]OQY76638.1 MAG: hypothetical protein B6D45_03435 [Ignavibacteriales bacterium UTCHB3]MBV6445497.1 hypothetical protein [Ignavibacteriaceae bacterium]
MNDQKKTELRVGLTVIMGIIVLLWVIGWSKNLSFGGAENKVTVEFQNVSGLEVGDDVTMNGVRKGFVDAITVKEGAVLVELQLDNDVRIPVGSRFFVSMMDLMGGKKIEIKTTAGKDFIDLTKLQKGEFQFDVPEVMGFVGDVGKDIPAILGKIDTALNAINSYLGDNDMKRDLKSGMKDLAGLAKEAREMLRLQRDQIDYLIKSGILLTKNADSLTSTASAFVKNNQDSVTAAISSLNSLLNRSDKLIVKLDGLVDETLSGKNNLGKILYDDSTYAEMQKTLKDARDLLDLIKKQLKNEGINVRARIELF